MKVILGVVEAYFCWIEKVESSKHFEITRYTIKTLFKDDVTVKGSRTIEMKYQFQPLPLMPVKSPAINSISSVQVSESYVVVW